jgi:hypothetical protein
MTTEYNKLEEEPETSLPPRRLFEDTGRDEEPWDTSTEDLIKEWRESCSRLATAHEQSARACKRKHVLYGLPSLMIPMVMTPLSAALKDQDWISYVEMSAFMCTAVTSAMVQFFNFSGKTERHFSFSARYADLVTDIDQELAKPRHFRQQVDTFSLKVKMMYDALNRSAPDL